MMSDLGLPTRYTNYKLLGSGAIGSVYKVTDSQTGNEVALKYIASTNPALAESLETEFSTLSVLSHNNLISVYDYGRSESGHPYFTMNLVHGPNLENFFKTTSNVSKISEVIMGILSALEYLSTRNIVHGDIKPENIMISTDSEPIPILLDFGLATLSQTNHNKIFGTPRFIAPEILDAKQYSPKSDIYALGHTLIECLTNATTPISSELSEDYFSKSYDNLNEVLSNAGIAYSRNLASYILELSDPSLSKRTDSISSAMQNLSIISRSSSREGIRLESSHYYRKSIDDYLVVFLKHNYFDENLIILKGSFGAGKKVHLKNMISQAQLLNFTTLNYVDLARDAFSLQTFIDVLSINLNPNDSKNLLDKHLYLLRNLRKAEESKDLDNLGIIYSNITEYLCKLSAIRPVLVILPNLESQSSDLLKFLLYMINEVDYQKAQVKFALSLSTDIPSEEDSIPHIESIVRKANHIQIQGLDHEELKILCNDIFQDNLFTDDELNRILSITNGVYQFILDYLNYLVISKVITRIERTYYIDHKLLIKEYANTKYNDMAEDIIALMSKDDIFFLNLLSTNNAPMNLKEVENLLNKNLFGIIEKCDEYGLLEIQDNSISLKSTFLRNSIIHHIDSETQAYIHELVAKYTLINTHGDYFKIATHYIQSGKSDEAYKYGLRAAENLISTHEYYSAYRILSSLKDIADKQDNLGLKVRVLEIFGGLELTLGYVDDSLRDYHMLVDMTGDDPSSCRLYTKLGDIERLYKGNASKAEEYYNHALSLARLHGDREIEATALTSIGSALKDVAFLEKAAEIAQTDFASQYANSMSLALYFHTMAGNTKRSAEIRTSLDRYLGSDDLSVLSNIYDSIFINAFYSGDYKTASSMTQKLIAISEKSCDQLAMVRHMGSQGGIHYVQGHFNNQIEILKKSYNLIKKYQLYRDFLGVISNLALAYIAIGKYRESLAIITEGQKSIKSEGISVVPLFYYSISAHLFLYLGHHYKDQFDKQISQLEALAKKNKNNHSLGHKELICGEYRFFYLKFDQSLEHYHNSLDIFLKASAKDDSLDSLLRLSLTCRFMNNHETARDYAKQAAKIFREINCGYLKPLYSYVIALAECHDKPDSLAPMLEAIDTSRAFGTREWTWQIQFHLARLYKQAGDISNSVKYCREAINTLKEITESFDNSEQISSYLQVPLRTQVFDFVKSLKS